MGERKLISISFQRDIPVRYDVDVFVAGGGPSGAAAALAASYQGSKVYLAEGQTCFGGMCTAGMVFLFCPIMDNRLSRLFVQEKQIWTAKLLFGWYIGCIDFHRCFCINGDDD